MAIEGAVTHRTNRTGSGLWHWSGADCAEAAGTTAVGAGWGRGGRGEGWGRTLDTGACHSGCLRQRLLMNQNGTVSVFQHGIWPYQCVPAEYKHLEVRGQE